MLRPEEIHKLEKFSEELERLINMRGIDSILGMPDYQIRGYLIDQLRLLQETIDLIERSRRNLVVSLNDKNNWFLDIRGEENGTRCFSCRRWKTDSWHFKI